MIFLGRGGPGGLDGPGGGAMPLGDLVYSQISLEYR